MKLRGLKPAVSWSEILSPDCNRGECIKIYPSQLDEKIELLGINSHIDLRSLTTFVP